MKRFIVLVAAMVLVVLCFTALFAGEGRFVFSGKVVEDKRTGLTWTRAGDLGTKDWNGAQDLIKELNADEYAGQKDWRLPTSEELQTLTMFAIKAGSGGGLQIPGPYQLFTRMGFNNIKSGWYWSSSSKPVNAPSAMVVSMFDGKMRSENKESDFWVWPVRSGK